MEILIIGLIFVFVLQYNKKINTNKFIKDNSSYFNFLREDDYDFYVKAKYGDQINPSDLFSRRLRDGFITIFMLILLFLMQLSFINIILAIVVGYIVFKSSYTSLRSYYKKHLHEINLRLPYFLRIMEIMAQHYTIPVALSRSIDSAPDIFKPGLRELVEKINAGDSSVNPYMDFAKQYPVSDSVRMMRLLYRLGLGAQANKHEQLIMFSRSVSSLQNKAREQKYKDRLRVMESKTMLMLGVTGGGVMVLLILAMVSMMKF